MVTSRSEEEYCQEQVHFPQYSVGLGVVENAAWWCFKGAGRGYGLGMRLLLLICCIFVFGIMAIIGLLAPGVDISVTQWFGIAGIGLALFAAAHLPIS